MKWAIIFISRAAPVWGTRSADSDLDLSGQGNVKEIEGTYSLFCLGNLSGMVIAGSDHRMVPGRRVVSVPSAIVRRCGITTATATATSVIGRFLAERLPERRSAPATAIGLGGG